MSALGAAKRRFIGLAVAEGVLIVGCLSLWAATGNMVLLYAAIGVAVGFAPAYFAAARAAAKAQAEENGEP